MASVDTMGAKVQSKQPDELETSGTEQAAPSSPRWDARARRIAAGVGMLLAVPAVALAAWILSATISGVTISQAAASVSVAGDKCTDVAGGPVVPGQALAECKFTIAANTAGFDDASKYTASADGTNIVSRPAAADIQVTKTGTGTANVFVTVRVETQQSTARVTQVTLTFTP